MDTSLNPYFEALRLVRNMKEDEPKDVGYLAQAIQRISIHRLTFNPICDRLAKPTNQKESGSNNR